MSEIVIIRRTESRSERHSQIIYRKGIDHYYATCNTKDIPKNEAHVWDRKKIHARDYCPEDPGSLTVAPDPTPRGGYVKFPRYEFDRGSRNHGDMRYLKARFLREAMICERIRQNPHINLASYHGCMIKDGRVRAICYSGYSLTLEQCVNPEGRSKKAFRYGKYPLPNRSRVIHDIYEGIRHLHTLGLIHNDLKPTNIMLRRDGTAVIIDFDSCIENGSSLKDIGRTEGWHDADVRVAQQSNDLDAIAEIEEWLSDRAFKRYKFD